jgi:dTDP-4-amino-4,6-dideoxygalactose transaminase
MPADIDAFKEICGKYNLKLIEDAACAAGSEYKGVKIGNHSDLVCFSFHPRKVISTGDGGMITTSSEEYYNRLRLLRQHGMSVNDRLRHESKKVVFEDHLEIGYNYRMTDIQAAVGIQQLEKLDWIVKERRKIAHHYLEAFKDIDCIRLPYEDEGCLSNYQSFSIYLKETSPISRNELMDRLLENGISSRRGIMTSHRTTAYKDAFKELLLPISEDACDNSIMIPLYVPMSEIDINLVTSSIISLLKGLPY